MSSQDNPLLARRLQKDTIRAFITTRKEEILSLSGQEQIEALCSLHTDIGDCYSRVGRQADDEDIRKRLDKLEALENLLIDEAAAIDDLLAERGIGRDDDE